jgi:cytosine/adenosine deaminase-related metal-dependent hydrolase
MSMDPQVGNFAEADVLVEGKQIAAVGPNLFPAGAQVIDARGRIVMPGFVDTHHHQFETALRSFLADGLLFNDGKPHGLRNALHGQNPGDHRRHADQQHDHGGVDGADEQDRG